MQRPPRSELGAHWDLDPEVVFLNHGSFGACPRFIIEEQQMWREKLEREPVRFMERDLAIARLEVLEKLADFINCDANDLALVSNATTGVNTILRSIEFERGDEILVPNHAYQACRNAIDFVTQRWGAKTVVCNIPFPLNSEEEIIEAVMERVTGRTKLAMIDVVTSATGLRIPFERLVLLLESAGVEVLLDAAHGPGMIDFNIKELDASYVTGNCHKWLMTPKGSAFLYVKRDLQHKIHPLSISHGMTFPLGDSTRFRHEFDWVGTQDPTPWLCIPRSIDGFREIIEGGWEKIRKHNHALVVKGRNILCDALGIEPPCPDTMLGSIATLKLENQESRGIPLHEPDPLHERLLDEFGIQVPVWYWPSPEGRYIRISAQLYNHVDEYHFLAESLLTAQNNI